MPLNLLPLFEDNIIHVLLDVVLLPLGGNLPAGRLGLGLVEDGPLGIESLVRPHAFNVGNRVICTHVESRLVALGFFFQLLPLGQQNPLRIGEGVDGLLVVLLDHLERTLLERRLTGERRLLVAVEHWLVGDGLAWDNVAEVFAFRVACVLH